MIQEQRWDWAVYLLRSALWIEPGDAKSFYLLAMASHGAGDDRSAWTAIGKAIELKPQQHEFLELRSKLSPIPSK
jgi:Flp pilus assembly protein TadD